MTFWLHQNDSFYNIVNSLKIYIEKAYYRRLLDIVPQVSFGVQDFILNGLGCMKEEIGTIFDHFEYKFRILTMRPNHRSKIKTKYLSINQWMMIGHWTREILVDNDFFYYIY
ncbi:unnamed protein product [Rhizophagus irregularis]|nr:unnamed protein product [Rhizophagus irregularis]